VLGVAGVVSCHPAHLRSRLAGLGDLLGALAVAVARGIGSCRQLAMQGCRWGGGVVGVLHVGLAADGYAAL
jgi:hypothetical protein